MKVNDPHMVFNSLISKKLSGELTPGEEEQFNEALSKEPDLKLQLDEFGKIWDSMDAMAEQQNYDMDAEWSALSGKMPDFHNEKVPAGKGRSLLYYTYRIAAVLITGVFITFAWLYANRFAGTEVMEAQLEPIEILLEDGTMVVLNRDSKIRYSKEFGTGTREVSLSGEAWFDVARDTSRPFVIDAGSALVEVLGTSFNVNAYKENPIVEITVESGVVAVKAKEDLEEQIILRAGNSGSYNSRKHELMLESKYNPNNFAWRSRELFFEDTPLLEVADLIGKVYNVSVVIPRAELASCPITVSFSGQDLEAVLNVLEVTLDLEISRSGDVITLNGRACIE